LNRRT